MQTKRRPRGPYVPPYDPHWQVDGFATANGRSILPGTEVSIQGVRGRFRFIQRVATTGGDVWLDFWGGPSGSERFRSFHPSRVRTVHRLRQTGTGLLELRQEQP